VLLLHDPEPDWINWEGYLGIGAGGEWDKMITENRPVALLNDGCHGESGPFAAVRPESPLRRVNEPARAGGEHTRCHQLFARRPG
jgi:hypothetical protein